MYLILSHNLIKFEFVPDQKGISSLPSSSLSSLRIFLPCFFVPFTTRICKQYCYFLGYGITHSSATHITSLLWHFPFPGVIISSWLVASGFVRPPMMARNYSPPTWNDSKTAAFIIITSIIMVNDTLEAHLFSLVDVWVCGRRCLQSGLYYWTAMSLFVFDWAIKITL